MWVHEEPVGQDLLTNIINKDHENVKYLPGYLLPKNVLAFSDLATICHDSNVLIFALPHQYLEATLNTVKNNLASENVQCLSLIKGLPILMVLILMVLLCPPHRCSIPSKWTKILFKNDW
jgi:glycerol-3-phosphate dehydrogenase (NAD+)